MARLTRIDDWPAALNAYIAGTRHEPFRWGKNDCLMGAANCVQLITGQDPAKPWRGRYRTEAGATKIVRRAGGWPKLLATACRSIGMKRIKLPLAQRGDIVTGRLGINGRSAAGICLGTHAAFPGRDGLEFYPITACHKLAWKVG